MTMPCEMRQSRVIMCQCEDNIKVPGEFITMTEESTTQQNLNNYINENKFTSVDFIRTNTQIATTSLNMAQPDVRFEARYGKISTDTDNTCSTSAEETFKSGGKTIIETSSGKGCVTSPSVANLKSQGHSLKKSPTKRPATCKECGKQFTRASNMIQHYEVVHLKLKRHKCEKCGLCIGDRTAFNRHMRKHHEQPLRCQRCNNQYKNYLGWKCHIRKCFGLEATEDDARPFLIGDIGTDSNNKNGMPSKKTKNSQGNKKTKMKEFPLLQEENGIDESFYGTKNNNSSEDTGIFMSEGSMSSLIDLPSTPDSLLISPPKLNIRSISPVEFSYSAGQFNSDEDAQKSNGKMNLNMYMVEHKDMTPINVSFMNNNLLHGDGDMALQNTVIPNVNNKTYIHSMDTFDELGDPMSDIRNFLASSFEASSQSSDTFSNIKPQLQYFNEGSKSCNDSFSNVIPHSSSIAVSGIQPPNNILPGGATNHANIIAKPMSNTPTIQTNYNIVGEGASQPQGNPSVKSVLSSQSNEQLNKADIQHGTQSLACMMCDAVLASNQALLYHEREHAEAGTIMCKLCCSFFSRLDQLKEHVKYCCFANSFSMLS